MKVSVGDEQLFREFCDNIINADGCMLLRMIGVHANELFTQDVLKVLWDSYRSDFWGNTWWNAKLCI